MPLTHWLANSQNRRQDTIWKINLQIVHAGVDWDKENGDRKNNMLFFVLVKTKKHFWLVTSIKNYFRILDSNILFSCFPNINSSTSQKII